MKRSRTLAAALFAIGTIGHLGAVASQSADGITRLAPRDLSELPAGVRNELTRRGCTIPQAVFEPTTVRNVIRGNFFGMGNDWAVLCSRDGASSILVFRGATVRSEMVHRTDTDFLQGDGRGEQVFSRAIHVVSPASIRQQEREAEQELPESKKGPVPTHDGILDAFQGKASDTWYWYRGQWVAVGHWD